mgnify:CR=1 FL=1
MNLMIGDKIKQLRQRDGRKQEELANALGVSPQAVSRWEANGGYPDMEIIPSIANYFNISIDELFGYSRDRQEKLKSILDTAEREINAQGDLTECIEMLRSAANEFPSEPHILIKLGYALNIYGWKKYGAVIPKTGRIMPLKIPHIMQITYIGRKKYVYLKKYWEWIFRLRTATLLQ